MIFTVLWTPKAEQDLAALWIGHADRRAVATAADTIDRSLGRDPASRGRPLFDTVRSLFVAPLGVEFEVVEDDRIVSVLAVWEDAGAAPGDGP